MWIVESGDHQLSLFFLNYSTLCTQVIAEGANGLTTPEVEKVLIKNNYYSGKFTKKQQVQSEVNLDMKLWLVFVYRN